MFRIKLKELREKAKLSQAKFANEIGVSQSTVGMWENGKNNPEHNTLLKIAKYFKVSTDYLLYGFDRTELTSLTNMVRYKRSIKEFSKDTGIDEFYLNRLCSGVEYKQPPIDTIVRIAINNENDWLVDTESLFKAAGYDLEEISSNLLEDIPLELLHHYQEQNMTEAEMIIAYIKYRQAEREDVSNEGIGNDIHTLAAHKDGEEWTKEELEDIENFKKYVISKRKNKE